MRHRRVTHNRIYLDKPRVLCTSTADVARAQANISVCDPAVIMRWCAGWRAYTTGAGCRAPDGSSAAFEDLLFARHARSHSCNPFRKHIQLVRVVWVLLLDTRVLQRGLQCHVIVHAGSRYAQQKVAEHNTSRPLFLFFSPHSAHTPLQAPEARHDPRGALRSRLLPLRAHNKPLCAAGHLTKNAHATCLRLRLVPRQQATLRRFDFIAKRSDKPEHTRQVYTAMVAEADAAIGKVVEAYRRKSMWESTLFVRAHLRVER